MIAELEKVGQFIAQSLKEELIRQGKNATGKGIQSIDYYVTQALDDYSITIMGADYLKFVDKGRKGNPSYEFGQGGGRKSKMFEALLEWAKIKKSNLSGAKQRSFAFMAMRKIKKYGIKPTNYVDKAISQDEIRRMVEEAVGSYYNILIKKYAV